MIMACHWHICCQTRLYDENRILANSHSCISIMWPSGTRLAQIHFWIKLPSRSQKRINYIRLKLLVVFSLEIPIPI
jgi:hypothetical protein